MKNNVYDVSGEQEDLSIVSCKNGK